MKLGQAMINMKVHPPFLVLGIVGDVFEVGLKKGSMHRKGVCPDDAPGPDYLIFPELKPWRTILKTMLTPKIKHLPARLQLAAQPRQDFTKVIRKTGVIFED